MIAACGTKRWEQRAGEFGAVVRKHPVVVSRWVREASEIKRADDTFASELDPLDKALSKEVKERLYEIRHPNQKVQIVSPGADFSEVSGRSSRR